MAQMLKRLIIVGLLLLGTVTAAAVWWVNQPFQLVIPKGEQVVDVQVAANETPRRVASNLVEAGVQTSAKLLFEWFRWSGKATAIQAGSYEVSPGTTPRQLLDMLTSANRRPGRSPFWKVGRLNKCVKPCAMRRICVQKPAK